MGCFRSLNPFHDLEVGNFNLMVKEGLSQLTICLRLVNDLSLKVLIKGKIFYSSFTVGQGIKIGRNLIIKQSHSIIDPGIGKRSNDRLGLEPKTNRKEVRIVHMRDQIVPRVQGLLNCIHIDVNTFNKVMDALA